MRQQQVMEILSGRRRGLAAGSLRAAMRCASVPYACVLRARRWAYRAGLLPSQAAAGAAVISVGNLTTGGTGKTPLVAWLTARLVERGARPAVLTRGYKSRAGRSDEAELLRRLAPAVPVIVNADRLAGARQAVAGGADVLVMDDGFQHRRLRRDLDIVLIDATNPFGYGYCLPRGLLREPVAALRDAGAIVVTRADALGPDELAALTGRLARLAPSAAVAQAVHRPVGVVDAEGDPQELGALAGRKVFAFCGIGNPGSFFDTLGTLKADVRGTLAFDDHAEYDSDACRAVRDQARQSGAEALVTTEKDAVKLAGAELGLPALQLRIEVGIVAGRDELMRAVEDALRKRPQGGLYEVGRSP